MPRIGPRARPRIVTGCSRTIKRARSSLMLVYVQLDQTRAGVAVEVADHLRRGGQKEAFRARVGP